MKVFVLQEIETKEECEPAIEISGVFTTYRGAAEKLISKSYKALPVYVFRKPTKGYIDYYKRDGVFEYTAEIHEHETEE